MAWLKELFADAETSPRLTKWQEQFMADLRGRFELYGAGTFISDKQMAALKKVEEVIYA
jgi:hypothetical protein